jgi:tRNA (guanine-N7-)-methyltransferase
MADPITIRRLYGRAKGHKLRQGQAALVEEMLPRVSIPETGPLDAQSLFGDDRPLEFEIGFGGGEHLAAQARSNPDIGIIGCEPFVNGVAKLLATIRQEQLDTVRLWDDDVLHLLPELPEGCLSRVYILYPDPWPKRRQRKRRLVSDETVGALARLMRPGAELLFATDIDDYAGWTLERVTRSPAFTWTATRADDWRLAWPDWPGTRYEAKAIREGRRPSYLTFRRI